MKTGKKKDSPSPAEFPLYTDARAKFDRLTSMESFIAAGIHSQLLDKEIADFHRITLRTVRFHFSAICRKTGCRTRVQVALLVERAAQPYLSEMTANILLAAMRR